MSSEYHATAAFLMGELRKSEERRFKYTGLPPPTGLEARFMAYYMEQLYVDKYVTLWLGSVEDSDFESEDDDDDRMSMLSSDGDTIMFNEEQAPERKTESAGKPDDSRDRESDSPKSSCCQRIKE